ncbi:NIPSNAP family protein [Aeromicrobium sp.]|uniref:NIPSNAP family protein n=1 Tax=Aeromicrobium sp. TaxID=1871063 RepID=UPI002FCC5473
MTYELREYSVVPGQMNYLISRFEADSIPLMSKYGMEGVGYWVTREKEPRLVYVVRHKGDPSQAWQSFYADEAWLAVLADPRIEGSVTSVKSTMLDQLPGLR